MTRKNSSRMRTTRFYGSWGGGAAPGYGPGSNDPEDMVPSSTVQRVWSQGRVRLEGTTPSADRQTPVKTYLSATSSAGGKNQVTLPLATRLSCYINFGCYVR